MEVEPALILSKTGSYVSGLLFGKKFVLTTSTILNDGSIKDNFPKDFDPLKINPELLYAFNVRKTFEIVTEDGACPAKLRFYFASRHIQNIIKEELGSWQILEANTDKNASYISIFLILEVPSRNARDFVVSLIELYDISCRDLKPGDETIVRCTPFGIKHFLNTESKAIVSNTFGLDSALLLIDYAGVSGCEGGLINVGDNLAGMIVCCLKSWKNSSVGLVMGISLKTLLEPLVVDQKLQTTLDSSEKLGVENCLAQAVCGASWGTAVLLDKSQGVFITAAHVVDGPSVELFWKGDRFDVEVLYATPVGEVLDLAVIKVTSDNFQNSKLEPAKIGRTALSVGDTVYASGYSLFSKKYKPKPILTKGVVSKVYDTLVHTTCTILAGTSGGGLFNENFELVGVVIANICDNGIKYPKINMVVPISTIKPIIESYLKTEDVKTLGQLRKGGNIEKYWTLSKL